MCLGPPEHVNVFGEYGGGVREGPGFVGTLVARQTERYPGRPESSGRSNGGVINQSVRAVLLGLGDQSSGILQVVDVPIGVFRGPGGLRPPAARLMDPV